MGFDAKGLPKALIRIGDKPIIWHIMKYYSYFGFNEFLLCLGYKGEEIKKYFRKSRDFKIKFIDTGLNTNTGGRINRIEAHLDSDIFFATYGDGLSNINLRLLLNFHKNHGKIATLAAVRPHTPFGIVGVDSYNSLVTHFDEKPILDHWINGGFFIFNKRIFDYLKDSDILEKESFSRLVEDKNLAAYKHHGFWECMDTYKDNLRLNDLWETNKAPWALWKRKKNG